MKLSDAQYGALHQIIDHGPLRGEEIAGPIGMDGVRKIKFVCNAITAATMHKLLSLGMINVERTDMPRQKNAVGAFGRARKAVTITITEVGLKQIKNGDKPA